MQRLREQYGEYLVAHHRSGMKLRPIAISEVDAWHAELLRIEKAESDARACNCQPNYYSLDDCDLRRTKDDSHFTEVLRDREQSPEALEAHIDMLAEGSKP